MEVLLREDVPGLGDIGERVKVRPGYARNFLVPRGFAVEVGAASAASINHRMRQINKRKGELKTEAEKRGQELVQSPVELGLRVATGGKVFGSIRARDIAAKLAERGFEIDRRRVLLEEPIRTIGDVQVRVKLHPEVIIPITVTIAKLEATSDEEQQEAALAKKNVEAAVDAELGEDGSDEFAEEAAGSEGGEDADLEPPTEES